MKIKREAIGGDELHTIIRTAQTFETGDEFITAIRDLPGIQQKIERITGGCKKILSDAGLPSAEQCILVTNDGGWEPIAGKKVKRLLKRPLINGHKYVVERVEAFSDPWYAVELTWEIYLLEIARDPDTRLLHAFNIGKLVEDWEWRINFKKKVVSRLKQDAALDKSTANDDREFVAGEWHAEARAAANRFRKRKPDLSESDIARLVIKELKDGDPDFCRSLNTVRKII